VIEKLAAIIAVFTVIVIPLSCVFAGNIVNGRNETRQYNLGEIMLSVTDASADGDYLLKFFKGKKELITGDCAFRTHEPRTLKSTPLPGCRSLLAYCFSGGAHCCTTLFIATECGSSVSLDMADLGHSDKEVEFTQTKGPPGKVMKVHDWQFAYYGPEESDIQLSFVDSPAMTRLLVYDNGRWRVDRVGEFSEFYTNLDREAVKTAQSGQRRRGPGLTASIAIKAAYYEIMRGKPVEDAEEILNRLFPAEWRPKAGMVIQDINRAVYEFNPLEIVK